MKTVLIVDDEQIVLEVLQRILNRLGFKTISTDSGNSALKQFRSESFDLVLMDVLMPEKNGFEIAKEMKRIKPDQKIIMVTGLGSDAAVHQADSKEVKVDSVLSKPFSYEKVRSIIMGVLDNGNEVQTEKKVILH